MKQKQTAMKHKQKSKAKGKRARAKVRAAVPLSVSGTRTASKGAAPIVVNGRTLSELAVAVGVSASAMSKLWLGKRTPGLDTVLALSAALGTTVADTLAVFGTTAVLQAREKYGDQAAAEVKLGDLQFQSAGAGSAS